MADEKQNDVIKPSKDTVSKDNGSTIKAKDLNRIQVLKNIDGAAGFVCDIHTGICGPITQGKEEKE